jgi:hypothetical protein
VDIINALNLNKLKIGCMAFNDAQELFSLFFAIYFSLIIDRAHQEYKPWDTYNVWRGRSHNLKRALVAWITLFIVPLIHFSILFSLLGNFNINFDSTIEGLSNLILISLASFFDFGYYRIYEAIMHKSPESFFAEEELVQHLSKIRPDFWAHFMPGLLYVFLSTLIMLIAIYY